MLFKSCFHWRTSVEEPQWHFNIKKDKVWRWVLSSRALETHGCYGVLDSLSLQSWHNLESQEARHTVIHLCSPASHSCSTICGHTTSADNHLCSSASQTPPSTASCPYRPNSPTKWSHLQENVADSASWLRLKKGPCSLWRSQASPDPLDELFLVSLILQHDRTETDSQTTLWGCRGKQVGSWSVKCKIICIRSIIQSSCVLYFYHYIFYCKII